MVEAWHLTSARPGPVVLTFPAEIDLCNAGSLSDELGSALASATIVIADMTATTFCDCSGVRIMLQAQKQAAATGTELRLVVSRNVLRILELTRADRMLPIYHSLEHALRSEAAGTVDLALRKKMVEQPPASGSPSPGQGTDHRAASTRGARQASPKPATAKS